jgi:hypothetical protein
MDGSHSENKRCRIAKGAGKRKSRCVAFMHQGVIAPVLQALNRASAKHLRRKRTKMLTTVVLCDASTSTAASMPDHDALSMRRFRCGHYDLTGPSLREARKRHLTC